MKSPLHYPQSPTCDQVDNYHGTLVADPYRWLEETNSPQTQAWIASQNRVTNGFLESLSQREEIFQRLTELWNVPKISMPYRKGGRYFQLRNDGLQNQFVLCMFDGLEDEPIVLLDPNTLSSDGSTALANWSVSEDGRWLVYATSTGGSDWLTWHVREVATQLDLPDRVEWGKFSGAAWNQQGSGFYYSRYPTPSEGGAYLEVNRNHQLYFHALGTTQSQDELIYERPDQPSWLFSAALSDDGNYLVLTIFAGSDERRLLFYQDLRTEGAMVELISQLEAGYSFVGNRGSTFYLHTTRHAPLGRLVAVELDHPEEANWQTILPEGSDALQAIYYINEQFVAIYMHDAYHQVKRFDQFGRSLGEIALPSLGSVAISFGSQHDREFFYSFVSFAHPTAIYRYDLERGESSHFHTTPIQFDFANYTTRQVFATSKDGTRVPCFLIHRRNLSQNQPHPTLLYGYGGFNISMTPSFKISNLIWLERGGVLAVAVLRGGGEYGQAWHNAAKLDKKQNVFDDFIACAEHLIAEGITAPDRLAIQGASNGGLLVGACMTQRPELFAAALPAVGVMDMLRFHKFTIGWAWVSEYGSADDPEQFKTLLAYSPLHNLKAGVRYPATLITTGDFDDRVAPGHSFKFAAALQAAHKGDAPVLIRVQTNAGHGAGKPTSMVIQEQSDIWAFLTEVMGME